MPGIDGSEGTHLPSDPPETPATEEENVGETASSGGGESIFSLRSGILDPLTRQDSAVSAPEPEVSTEKPSTPQGAQDTSEDNSSNATGRTEDPQRSLRRRRRLKRRSESARARPEKRPVPPISPELEEQRRILRQRRRQKKRRVLLHRLRTLLKLIFIGVWGMLLWLWLHSAMWTFAPPVFTLSHNRLLQPSQVYPVIARWKGKPIYEIDPGKIGSAIKNRFDVVDRVIVRRRLFPAQLEILLLEKKPWAELYPDETQTAPYALAMPGELLSLARYTYRPQMYRDHPPFRLLIPPQTRLRQGYLTRLREIGWQAQHISGLHLLNVDARNSRRIILNFEEVPVILGSLNSGASTRLARLLPLLPKIREFREGIASVDLQWEGQATFHRKPNVRMSPPGEDEPNTNSN